VQDRLQYLKPHQGRAADLLRKEFASQKTADEAEADAKVAEQQVKEAELNRQIADIEVKHAEVRLAQRTLHSPLDGVVVERLLLPGEYRNDQSPVLTLAQINPLRVEVFVPTAKYGRIATGDKAKVHPEEPIGGEYEATVVVVDSVLDAASGTFGVRLQLPNPESRLPAGLKCRIKFNFPPSAG
jgi:RND family efflux transporter MFP subunit